jgi:hypothetical protein
VSALEHPRPGTAETGAPVETLRGGRDLPERQGGSPPSIPEEVVGGAGGDGSAWLQFAKDQLAREDARKESLDGRAVTIVTGSAAVVSLLVAAASLSIKNHAFHITHDAKLALVAAGGCFIAAALLAFLTAFPYGYTAPDAREIRDIADDSWDDPKSHVERVVTVTLMDVWGDIQNVNDKKGTAFLLAIVAEALGVVGVAVAAALLFF